VLKLAHAGLLATEKPNALPFASLAVGWNEYATPAPTVVAGVPEMTGATFCWVGAETAIAKGASEVVAIPSLALIVIAENVPAVVGVPDSRPVLLLNVAHVGWFAMPKVSALPSASLAVG
jgi:hypothetical protein